MYRCWKWYFEMLLVRTGFYTTKSDIRQYWCFACFQSNAQMFKLTKHSFLNSFGSDMDPNPDNVFFLFKGERIQISLKAGHHRPASETPLNGVSLACRWQPNVECWLGSFENSRGSGPVLLRNSIFLQGGGGPDPLSPSWIRAWNRTMYSLIEITENPFYRAHRLLYDALHTFYRMHNFFKLTKHSFLNSIRVWSGSKPFLQM